MRTHRRAFVALVAGAKEQALDYIEVFSNQQRIHSTIGYLSPADFERRRLVTLVPAA